MNLSVIVVCIVTRRPSHTTTHPENMSRPAEHTTRVVPRARGIPYGCGGIIVPIKKDRMMPRAMVTLHEQLVAHASFDEWRREHAVRQSAVKNKLQERQFNVWSRCLWEHLYGPQDDTRKKAPARMTCADEAAVSAAPVPTAGSSHEQ